MVYQRLRSMAASFWANKDHDAVRDATFLARYACKNQEDPIIIRLILPCARPIKITTFASRRANHSGRNSRCHELSILPHGNLPALIPNIVSPPYSDKFSHILSPGTSNKRSGNKQSYEGAHLFLHPHSDKSNVRLSVWVTSDIAPVDR